MWASRELGAVLMKRPPEGTNQRVAASAAAEGVPLVKHSVGWVASSPVQRGSSLTPQALDW